MPQLLKPARLESVLHNKRSHHNEKPMHHNKDPRQPKLNKINDNTLRIFQPKENRCSHTHSRQNRLQAMNGNKTSKWILYTYKGVNSSRKHNCYIMFNNIRIMDIPEREERERGSESLFKKLFNNLTLLKCPYCLKQSTDSM